MTPCFFRLFCFSFVAACLINSVFSGSLTAQSSRPTWTIPRADAGASGSVPETLPANLEVRWKTQTKEAIETTPVSDGVYVFVTDVMGGVEALDVQTGESVWRREFDTGFVASAGLYLPGSLDTQSDAGPGATAEVHPPLLVVADVEGNIEAMVPKTGVSLWKFTTEGQISAAPAFFIAAGRERKQKQQGEPSQLDSRVRVLQTSQDGNLYCLDAYSGKLIWKYETGDQIRCAASIGEGKTFLGGCDGGLHVVDLATGKATREPIPLGGPTGSTPAIAGDELYQPIMDGIVFSFQLDSGKNRWQFEDPDHFQEYRSSVAIGPDRIIVSSKNKHVDAISRKTGERLWRKTLRRRADASPLIAGDDVWIAASDGRLLRLSLATGEQTWSFETRGKFLASPAVLGDRLIIADDNGVVRCFGSPTR